MDRPRYGPLLCVMSLLALSLLAAAQDGQVKKRLTPKEIEALPSESAGAGTSGLPAVTTRVLFGDPKQTGLYTIELKVAPNTVIQAHTHRDTRTAVVISGLWYFGYGPRTNKRSSRRCRRARFTQNRRANRTLRGRVRKGRPSALPGMGQLTPSMPNRKERLPIPCDRRRRS